MGGYSDWYHRDSIELPMGSVSPSDVAHMLNPANNLRLVAGSRSNPRGAIFPLIGLAIVGFAGYKAFKKWGLK